MRIGGCLGFRRCLSFGFRVSGGLSIGLDGCGTLVGARVASCDTGFEERLLSGVDGALVAGGLGLLQCLILGLLGHDGAGHEGEHGKTGAGEEPLSDAHGFFLFLESVGREVTLCI